MNLIYPLLITPVKFLSSFHTHKDIGKKILSYTLDQETRNSDNHKHKVWYSMTSTLTLGTSNRDHHKQSTL